jgi:hypothetical protein
MFAMLIKTLKFLPWLVVLVLLVGCDLPSDTFRRVPLAPTPTDPPILLPESACDTYDFDHNPDIEDRMAYSLEEGARLRGVIDLNSGASQEPTLYLEEAKYTLRGVNFPEELQGRIVEVYGQVSNENPGVFLAEAYEPLPYAVLTGLLTIREYVCRESCNDWLLFEVQGDEKVYTYALSHYSNLYPSLWEQAGFEVSLAADIYDDKDYLGYYRLKLRYRCK